MNEWLSQIYGTSSAEDLEKTAQANLLAKLAEEQNIDLSQFSEDELAQLHAEVYGDAGDSQDQTPEVDNQQNAQDLQKEAQANFEEADFLGRVMAHSYVQELENIKVAGLADKARYAGGVAKAHMAPGSSSKTRKVVDHFKRNKGRYAAGGAAAGGFAAGRMSKKEKTASFSAFEKLAEEQAANILSATGYDPSTGMDMYAQQMNQQAPQSQAQTQPQSNGVPSQYQHLMQQQAQQAPNEQNAQGDEFQNAVADRAFEMLANSGYDINEIIARLQVLQQQGNE